MTAYADMTHEQLQAELDALQHKYAQVKAKGLSLNMARGKPSKAQLDLSMDMLTSIESIDDCISEDGTDCRNYGVLDGLPEAKRLMAGMLDDNPENVLVFGQSSLTIMYDSVARYWNFGALGSTPWCKLDDVKWLCPVPGYDRHFGVTEAFGIKLIPVPMDDNGPAMDEVEALVANDSSIKGIWCVPKYSNPTGITYSDEVVRRLAHMTCAAEDFRIFWDNAYCVHHLFADKSNQDQLLDIAQACAEAGNENRYLKFASTSKITFPGAGLAALAASSDNVAEIRQRMSAQAIGYDKLNQLRHVKFLRDNEGIAAHMAKHAEILAPKFALVERKLSEGLREAGGFSWSHPRGGYFVSFDTPVGCAKRTVALAKDAGVVLTGAGATWPYGSDPHDSNIRIAPSLPPLEELGAALDVLILCAKLAYIEKQAQA